MLICTRLTTVASLMLILCFFGESQAQINGLGDLPGGFFSSDSLGVSADGSVVVGIGSGGNTEAFRWTSRGIEGLGSLSGAFGESRAFGVSADGSVVVGRSNLNGSESEAFRWTRSGGMQRLEDFPSGESFSQASGVSADGSVIVGQGGREAFRWTSRGTEGLGDLPGGSFFSSAASVSADGSVVVGLSNGANGSEAFRWTSNGGMQGLGDLTGGGFSSRAYGVSADGSVVVGRSDGNNGSEAFRWTSSNGMQGLGIPPGFVSSFAMGASGDGSVVVGTISDGPVRDGDELHLLQAFVWQDGIGMRSLFDVLIEQGNDLSSWESLDEARAISADGRTIVGAGINSSGNREAFVATINVLEPVLLGDINMDETVNFLDISPFILLLSSGEFGAEADCNEDGEVNFLDIRPFVGILSSESSQL